MITGVFLAYILCNYTVCNIKLYDLYVALQDSILTARRVSDNIYQ